MASAGRRRGWRRRGGRRRWTHRAPLTSCYYRGKLGYSISLLCLFPNLLRWGGGGGGGGGGEREEEEVEKILIDFVSFFSEAFISASSRK